DRKSTRLNSSHLGTSYAVFCLKKKNILSTVDGSRARSTGKGGIPRGDLRREQLQLRSLRLPHAGRTDGGFPNNRRTYGHACERRPHTPSHRAECGRCRPCRRVGSACAGEPHVLVKCA